MARILGTAGNPADVGGVDVLDRRSTIRRLSLATVAAALVAALALQPASAKGPLVATLEGPGLDAPVAFELPYHSVADDPRRGPLEHLALVTGRFSAVLAGASLETWDAASRALRLKPPPGDLGPRYTLTYRLEWPGGGEEIVQNVYPYAEPRPTTYVAPGSWFVADPGLRDALVEAGLPGLPPGEDPGHGTWAFVVALAGLTVAALVRRRPGAGGARASA